MDATTRLDLALTLSARFRHRELRVALFLLRYSDPAGEWQGTFEEVGKVTGDSWRTVARSFASLQSAGVIHKVIDRSRFTRWRVICQPCHISDMPTGDMPNPPTPPPFRRSFPTRISTADPPARGMPNLTYHGGGGGSRDWGDLTDKPTDAQAESVRAMLATLRNEATREEIAARCSPELVRFALDAAARAPNVRDREAFAVHSLRTGSAEKAINTARERAEQVEQRKQTRLQTAREALRHHSEEAAAAAAELEAIDSAPPASLRAALREAVASVPGAAALFRLHESTPDAQIRKWARSSAWRQAVAQRLNTP